MLTMLEKVSAVTEDSRVSKSHLGNENKGIALLSMLSLSYGLGTVILKCVAR